MPIPSAVVIELTDEERAVLESWTRRRTSAQALALRARIVLAAAGCLTNGEIAASLGISRPTVTEWRKRFAERRLEGLLDDPRRGDADLARVRAAAPPSGDLQAVCRPAVRRQGQGHLWPVPEPARARRGLVR